MYGPVARENSRCAVTKPKILSSFEIGLGPYIYWL